MRGDGGSLFLDLPGHVKSDILALAVCLVAILIGLSLLIV
jgi:hypothetical protein